MTSPSLSLLAGAMLAEWHRCHPKRRARPLGDLPWPSRRKWLERAADFAAAEQRRIEAARAAGYEADRRWP